MRADFLVHGAAELLVIPGRGPRAGAAQGDLGIICDGAVAVAGEVVVAVGHSADLAPLADERTIVVNAAGKVVMPGFVDAHTHMVFAGERAAEFEQRIRGESYMQIMAAGGGIMSTVRATRAATLDELVGQSLARLERILEQGTTTAEVKTGYGLDTVNELKMLRTIAALQRTCPVELTPTFLGAHAVPSEWATDPDGYVDEIIGRMLPAVCGAESPLRPAFFDVFCEEGAFSLGQTRKLLTAAQALGLGLKVHADEFSSLGGAGLAAELGAVSADHLACTPAREVERMAAAGVVGVLLPGTTFGLGQTHYADSRAMVAAGLPVALGTDLNPGTCWCESMPFIVALACRYLHLTPAEAIVAATRNAACAVGLGDRVGSLQPGSQADLVVLDLPDYRHLAYRFGTNPVGIVVKQGRIVVDTGWCPVRPASRVDGPGGGR
jgi:imidazolonepropionase